MGKTKIEWADRVWNPTSGCTKVSAGCKNCYAERIAKRFWHDRSFNDVICHPERLDQPKKWKKPSFIFVDSMSDLFHQDVSRKFIANVWLTMQSAPWHTFLILTKRPDRMHEILADWTAGRDPLLWPEWPLPNVWLGVSAENQEAADERIQILLETPAAVRFVSVEPMLGQIYLRYYLPRKIPLPRFKQDKNLIVSDLDWVICGCESGAGARPCNIDDIRYLRNQCLDARIPFFLKQMMVDGKLVKMPELDGKVWALYPDGKHN